MRIGRTTGVFCRDQQYRPALWLVGERSESGSEA